MLFAHAVTILSLTVASAESPPAPEPKLVAVVLPPHTYSRSDEALGSVIQDRATGLLDATGHYSALHLKQIRRMAEGEGIAASSLDEDRVAWRAAVHLGADRVVASTLIKVDKGWSLVLEASSTPGQSPKAQTVRLPDDWAAAVDQGGIALAKALGQLDGTAIADGPGFTQSSAAMEAYAGCFQVLIRQPMGIENPNILLRDDLQTAVERCRSAVHDDPEFAEAHAALALALAIRGDDSEAMAELKGLSQKRAYLPMGWVAWFWVRTREESGPAGTEVLRKAVERDPGLLLYRGYLAEHLNALHEQRDALVAWQDYQRVCPRSPFVQARIGYTLARLGDFPGAEAASRKALEADSSSRALAMELAGRQIDAGHLAEAKATLLELLRSGKGSAEAYLRLGYSELRLGDADSAEPDLRQAIRLARAAADWRTRARAHLDLARIADQQGKHDVAVREVHAAQMEGYKSSLLGAEDPLIVKLSQEATGKETHIDLQPRPAEVSPYPMNSAGDLDPGGARPIPPPNAGIKILDF